MMKKSFSNTTVKSFITNCVAKREGLKSVLLLSSTGRNDGAVKNHRRVRFSYNCSRWQRDRKYRRLVVVPNERLQEGSF